MDALFTQKLVEYLRHQRVPLLLILRRPKAVRPTSLG